MLSPTRRLSLTRRIHEEILVIDRQTGEQIVVAPIACRGNQVKIGIKGMRPVRDPAPRGARAADARAGLIRTDTDTRPLHRPGLICGRFCF